MKKSCFSLPRHGLTLMELVVVLAILAALTTAATVATERVIMQQRMERTQESLAAAKKSVLGRHGGDSNTQNQQLAMDGFIADLGRPPLAVGTDPTLQAAELWANPRMLQPYGWKISTVDPEVSLACGWRGPYLELPVGAEQLLDGWGRTYVPLMLDEGAYVPATENAVLAGLTSLGADGEAGIAATDPLPLSEDLSCQWTTLTGVTATSNNWSLGIHVTVIQRDTNGDAIAPSEDGTLTVRLFGPNPETGDIMSIEDSVLITAPSPIPTVTFEDVPVGTKVLRAYYQVTDGPLYKSESKTIDVTRTGQTQWNLVLPSIAIVEEP